MDLIKLVEIQLSQTNKRHYKFMAQARLNYSCRPGFMFPSLVKWERVAATCPAGVRALVLAH